MDFSAFRSFHVEMRGASGGECVHLGIKDASQPDDGSELTTQRCLSVAWQALSVPLSAFSNVHLTRLYVVFEVVFQQSSASTVEFRNLWYSTSAS